MYRQKACIGIPRVPRHPTQILREWVFPFLDQVSQCCVQLCWHFGKTPFSLDLHAIAVHVHENKTVYSAISLGIFLLHLNYLEDSPSLPNNHKKRITNSEPKRCLLPYPDSPSSQALSEICFRRGGLSVFRPPLRPFYSSTHFHQVHERSLLPFYWREYE